MKNAATWKPSKYVYTRGRLVASRDPKNVAESSRLIANLIASTYQAHLEGHCRGRLLDLGCGAVPLYAAYKEFVSEIVCVDWVNSLHPIEHADFECDLGKTLPLDDCAFDTIILSDVLEHIPDPLLIWKEMSRLLTPGGKAIINVPFFYWLHETPYDYYRYTEFALRRFAELNGFNVQMLYPVGGVPEILADMIGKNLVVGLGLFGSYLATIVNFACSAFVNSSLGKKLSKKSSVRFPLAYFMIATKL